MFPPTASQLEEFNQIASHIREVLWLYAPDFSRVLYISPAYETVWGRTCESLREDPGSFLDAVHPEDRVRTETIIRAEHERGFDLQYRIVRPDGAVRWIWDRGLPVKDQAGHIYRIAGIAEDITEQKLADERIRLLQTITMDVAAAHDLPSALELVLRRVCEKTGWALGQAWLPRPDGLELDCCPAWFAASDRVEKFRILSSGIPLSPGKGLPGRVYSSKQHAWIRDVTQDTNFPRAEAARAGGLKAALGVPILSGHDVIAVLEFFLSEPREEDERLVQVIAAVAAQIGLVIERKRAEEKLRWSEERLRLLLNSTAEGIFGVDLEGRYMFCNASSLRLLGYDRSSDLLGKDMHALIAHSHANGQPYPKEEHPVVQSLLDASSVFADEGVFWRKDGVSFPTEYWSYPILQEGRHIGAVITFLDITERKLAHESLRLSEERFLKAFQASPEPITISRHRDGIILEVNERWQSVYGYSRDEAVGRNSLDLISPEGRERIRGLLAKEHSLRELEIDFRTRHSETRHISLAAEQIVINNELCDIFLHRDNTERTEAEAELRASAEQLRALSARLQSAREEEGSRIAREIHDELGSLLTSLRWDLEWVAKGLPEMDQRPPVQAITQKVEDMLGQTDTMIGIVRRVASELRPSVLDILGFVDAIQWQARQFQDRTGIVVYCDSAGLGDIELNQDQSETAFRIFQEALTNISRHAEATRVDVTMAEREDVFTMTIRDDGRGIADQEKSGPLSIGLLWMRERARLIGAELHITGVEGEGTAVAIRIPLPRERSLS